jgi:16S rRNA (cytidine1402-2'-O)-methyltransferase
MKGTLYIVSTPIGNLEDITLRALRVLKEVDIIAAEDTRHSLKLLTHYGISKPLISYWGEKEKTKSEEIIEKLQNGQSVALISDSGTPGISDPGYLVIKKAIEKDFPVIVIPGPTAFVAALIISGFKSNEFTFFGFLPQGERHRRKLFEELVYDTKTLIFYESPYRLLKTLTEMEKYFQGRKAALIKELTKIHEKVIRGTISEIISIVKKDKIAGEYIIIIEGRTSKDSPPIDDALKEVELLMKKGLSRKDAVAKIAEVYNISRKELYDRSLSSLLTFSPHNNKIFQR